MWGASRGWGGLRRALRESRLSGGWGVPGEQFPKPETRLYRGPTWYIGNSVKVGLFCTSLASLITVRVSGCSVDSPSPLVLCPQVLFLRPHTALGVWLSPRALPWVCGSAPWTRVGVGLGGVQGSLGFPFSWMVSNNLGLRAGSASSLFHVWPVRTCRTCRNLKTTIKPAKVGLPPFFFFLVCFLSTLCTRNSQRCP